MVRTIGGKVLVIHTPTYNVVTSSCGNHTSLTSDAKVTYSHQHPYPSSLWSVVFCTGQHTRAHKGRDGVCVCAAVTEAGDTSDGLGRASHTMVQGTTCHGIALCYAPGRGM